METRTVVSTVVEHDPPALIGNIPGAIEPSWNRVAAPTPDFEASVSMLLQADRWNSFGTATQSAIPDMGTYLRRKLGYAGLPVPDPNERIAAQGSCEQNVLPAVEEWVESGRGGHDAIGHTQFSDSNGLVLCYVDARGAHI